MGDEIIKVLEKLGEQFGIAIDWTSQNIVPYIQQLTGKIVIYEIATSWAWIGISLFIIIGFILGIKPVNKLTIKLEDKYCDFEYIAPLYIFLCGAIALGFFICIICQIFDIVTCYTFPEKIIMEYIQSLLNSK